MPEPTTNPPKPEAPPDPVTQAAGDAFTGSHLRRIGAVAFLYATFAAVPFLMSVAMPPVETDSGAPPEAVAAAETMTTYATVIIHTVGLAAFAIVVGWPVVRMFGVMMGAAIASLFQPLPENRR